MNFNEAKVLVIDDDCVMMSYLINRLQRIGVSQVLQAKDGVTGLSLVERHKPDVIISDIHMEPMNGFDFVKSLRKSTVINLRKIPVLIMSSDSCTDTFNKAVGLGIAGYIVKPPTYSTLQVKLKQALLARRIQ